MTTVNHAAGGVVPDWKVTTAHRVLTVTGWAAALLALSGTVTAAVAGIEQAWWGSAGMAAVALILAILVPEPVPRDLITGSRNHIDTSGTQRF
jgi:hypothetical protein